MIELTPLARELLAGRNMAYLATVLPDGGPHSVPIWIDLEGDRIRFITSPSTVKARNIARDPRVAISLTESGNDYRMAAVRGRVVEVIDGDPAWEIIDRIATKYTGGPYSERTDRVVYVVEPEKITEAAFG